MPGKSAQQVNEIVFVPVNDKNKCLSLLMIIGKIWRIKL